MNVQLKKSENEELKWIEPSDSAIEIAESLNRSRKSFISKSFSTSLLPLPPTDSISFSSTEGKSNLAIRMENDWARFVIYPGSGNPIQLWDFPCIKNRDTISTSILVNYQKLIYLQNKWRHFLSIIFSCIATYWFYFNFEI